MFSTFLVVEQEQDLAKDLQRLQRQTASAGFTEYISSGEIQVSTKKSTGSTKKIIVINTLQMLPLNVCARSFTQGQRIPKNETPTVFSR